MVGNIALALICLIQSLFTSLSLHLNKRIKKKDCQHETANGFTFVYGLFHQSSTKIINFHSWIKFENILKQNVRTESEKVLMANLDKPDGKILLLTFTTFFVAMNMHHR